MDRKNLGGDIWKKVRVIGYTDSKNLEEAVKLLKGVENKRTRIEIVYLKEMIEWRSGRHKLDKEE